MRSKFKLWLSEIIGEADEAEGRLEPTLLPIPTYSARLKKRLGPSGANLCSWCRRLFRGAEPGVLFDGGELVCFDCVPDWWKHRCPALSVAEREPIERKLASWLRKHHGAQVVMDAEKLPETHLQAFRIVADCAECGGRGTRKDRRCRYCGGRGTMWVVIRKKAGAAARSSVFAGIRLASPR